MNLAELRAWAGCGKEASLDKLEEAARTKVTDWVEEMAVASWGELQTFCEGKLGHWERELAELKARRVPTISPKWRMVAAEHEKWKTRLGMVSALLVVGDFQARLRALKGCISAGHRRQAREHYCALRRILEGNPDEEGLRLAILAIEDDLDRAFGAEFVDSLRVSRDDRAEAQAGKVGTVEALPPARATPAVEPTPPITPSAAPPLPEVEAPCPHPPAPVSVIEEAHEKPSSETKPLVEEPPAPASPTPPGRPIARHAALVGVFVIVVAVVCWAISVLVKTGKARVRDDGQAVTNALAIPRPGTPKEGSSSQRWTNSLGMVFAPVPGTDARFSIWETRVRDFEEFVKATGYDTGRQMQTIQDRGFRVARGATWRNPGFAQGPDHPVVGVNHDDGRAFCKWLTDTERQRGLLTGSQHYRLPIDAEWSRAVGLPQETGTNSVELSADYQNLWPWGDRLPPPKGAGNYADETMKRRYPFRVCIRAYDDGYVETAPVGSFSPNALGLYDLGGNAAEICEEQPGGSGAACVLRGGSWFTGTPDGARSAFRSGENPRRRSAVNSFRCVLAENP